MIDKNLLLKVLLKKNGMPTDVTLGSRMEEPEQYEQPEEVYEQHQPDGQTQPDDIIEQRQPEEEFNNT
jgi:hypothetical protein